MRHVVDQFFRAGESRTKRGTAARNAWDHAERMVREICEAFEVDGGAESAGPLLEDLQLGRSSTLDLSWRWPPPWPAKLVLSGPTDGRCHHFSQSPLKALSQDLLVHEFVHEIALERLEESDVVNT